jgi:hypothetical protein
LVSLQDFFFELTTSQGNRDGWKNDVTEEGARRNAQLPTTIMTTMHTVLFVRFVAAVFSRSENSFFVHERVVWLK